MTDRPGHVWGLIEEWLDTFRYKKPSQRDIAKVLKVSSSSLGDYKYARSTPPPIFVVRLARLLEVPYEKALDAMLRDTGYRGEGLAYMLSVLDNEAPTSAASPAEQRSEPAS